MNFWKIKQKLVFFWGMMNGMSESCMKYIIIIKLIR